jgi:hypothetical protein
LIVPDFVPVAREVLLVTGRALQFLILIAHGQHRK